MNSTFIEAENSRPKASLKTVFVKTDSKHFGANARKYNAFALVNSLKKHGVIKVSYNGYCHKFDIDDIRLSAVRSGDTKKGALQLVAVFNACAEREKE